MPRYIDADEIQYTMLYKENWITNTGVEKQGVWKDDLDKMPTADVVEVVRCRDCRWYEINELKSDGTEDKRYKPSICVLHSRIFRDNYYCADGERA